jgi:cephalosporin-C deacetylase-like acetyl esterase
LIVEAIQRRIGHVILSTTRSKEFRLMKSGKPYRFLSLTAFLFVAPVLALAQDAEMLRHFDYDRTAPLNVKQIGVQRRANATVYDITYDSPKGGVVPAYLVVPKGRGPFAAIIWGHWYWQNSSMRNRREFLDEAIALAPSGAVSLLTDGPINRPSHVESKDPLDENIPLEFFQQVMDMRRGVDVLLARRDVDSKRIAFVGHSYNAGVGALLSGLDRRFKAFVLMAGSTSDEVGRKSKAFQDFRQRAGPEKLDALIARYKYLDQGLFAPYAAPAVVFLQYGSHDSGISPEQAQEYATVVSEPKQFKIYDADHNLNAEARRDRIHFLVEQLKLKPVPDAVIAAIPNLYQPPQPN